MNESSDDQLRLLRMERILAGLLRYGAIVASGWIAIGMALFAYNNHSSHNNHLATISNRCLAIGIVLLIVLPVLRVAIVTVIFVLEKDFRFALISGAVLAIISLGFLLGTMNSHFDFL